MKHRARYVAVDFQTVSTFSGLVPSNLFA